MGLSASFGAELTGVKLSAGVAWDRAQLALDLYAGALTLPIGPGAGAELSARWVALPGDLSAALQANAGFRIGAPPTPVFKLKLIGQARGGMFAGYVYGQAGFPQLVGGGVGGKAYFDGSSLFLEAHSGVPMLVNGEAGLSWGP